MELLTDKLRKSIPELYSQEESKDPIVHVKFFDCFGSWIWYVTEFDGEDTFFGFVDGSFPEFGYFSLKELQSIKIGTLPRIERDLYFKPCKMSEARSR